MISRQIQSSPFLPFLPAIALGDLGRVKFPGTTRAGRGLLTTEERNPNDPANVIEVTGPTSYTRAPHAMRVGGIYPPRTSA